MEIAYPVFITVCGKDYLVYIPDLKIYTEGKSYADAIRMARDAIGLSLMTKQDFKESVPEPSSYDRALSMAQKDADEEMDFSQGILSLVDVDVEEYRKKHDKRMVRKNCTIPYYLNEQAEKAGINFSRLLQEALIARLGVH
ncbi:MAG: type II toxin-antitoxin system HicB family antitoxin [Lachnospiraceae bacterium]|nr:type II toxin-antitoxin system HicB family antitoxin [Lachnospiraceae bacterium]